MKRGAIMSNATDERRVVEAVTPKLLIGGQWRDAERGAVLTVEDPSTGGPLCQVADADEADARAALDAAVAAQDEWGGHPPRERGEILRRAFEQITARA